MEIFGLLWTEIIMRPMINSLVFFYYFLFGSFGLSIIVFTVIIRLLMIPLTVRQYTQMKKMQVIQPRMKALQEKYKDKKTQENRRKLSQETMGLYKEAGVSPIGCLGPMFIQMPIWIGLYRAIIKTIPPTPEGLSDLSVLIYSWNPGISSIPLSSIFLSSIDLADLVSSAVMPWNFGLPILVGASMWLMQKMTTVPSTDPRQRQTNQMMLGMMPIMFGGFTWQFPSGLAIYILFSNLVGIVIQYFISGKDMFKNFSFINLGQNNNIEQNTDIEQNDLKTTSKETSLNTKDGDNHGEDIHRKRRRRSNRRGSSGNRRRTGRS